FLERGPGQGAHRVETHVAEELHPDLVAEPDRNGTAESRGDQRLGNLARPIGPRAVGLAETDPIALVVTDDARLDDIRGKVRERSHNPPRLDGGRDDTARVHSLQPQPVELAAVTLEVPPRNAVLRAHDRRVWSEERRDLRRKAGESVRLDAEKDDVRGADCLEVAGHLRPDLEVTLGARHPQAALLHRAQVRTAREEHDVGPCVRQSGADVAANGAGSRDDDLHDFCAKASATTRRWILPVAVRGIVSVM